MTVTLDEALRRALKARAARTGSHQSQVMEEALRHFLGFELLERLWAHNQMDEEAATALAVEAQHRAGRRRSE